MLHKIIFLSTLLTYSIVVSQPFMYILALKRTQMNLEANAYLELRKQLDAGMRANFTYVVYAALLSNLLWVLLTIAHPTSLLFVTALIAFIALLADTLLTLKGNMPINAIINTWTADRYPENWAEYRSKWLNLFRYRQIATITGFVSLLVGAVFGAN